MGRVHVNLTMHPVSELTKETNSVVDTISSKVEDIQKEEEVTSKSIEEDVQTLTKNVEPLHAITEEINKSEEVVKEIAGSAEHITKEKHAFNEITKQTDSIMSSFSSNGGVTQKREPVISENIAHQVQQSLTKIVEPIHSVSKEEGVPNKANEASQEITGVIEEHENTPPKIVEDIQNTIKSIPLKRKTIRLASFLKQIIPEDELALVLHKWFKKSPEEIHAIFNKIDLETTEIKNWITKHENIKE